MVKWVCGGFFDEEQDKIQFCNKYVQLQERDTHVERSDAAAAASHSNMIASLLCLANFPSARAHSFTGRTYPTDGTEIQTRPFRGLGKFSEADQAELDARKVRARRAPAGLCTHCFVFFRLR